MLSTWAGLEPAILTLSLLSAGIVSVLHPGFLQVSSVLVKSGLASSDYILSSDIVSL